MAEMNVTEAVSEQRGIDWNRLPEVVADVGEPEVLRRLDRLAREGKLAGFHAGGAGLFEVAAFGEPFDRRLIATSTTESSRTKLKFRAALGMRMPLIYAGIVGISIWPGVWLTHSMLSTYWGWYGQWPEWVTWAWYMPLTVLPLPLFIPRMVRKSETAAFEHAREQIGKIAGALASSARGAGERS